MGDVGLGGLPPVVAAKVRVPRAPALDRRRLTAILEEVWQRRLGLVLGPAGSGKTTLLAQFAAASEVPVAWYRAESSEGDAQALVRHLESALTAAMGGLPGGWESVEDAARAVEEWQGERALLVVDDLHLLESTPAERALERFVGYAPPALRVLIGSRRPPQFNLPRLRVSGELLELDADDLRFRSWEVERLFGEFWGEPLPPDEVAELARRTEGWAAGLQLFHLATQGKPPSERRRTLDGLASRSRLVREYLAHNVLDDLPEDLRSFLTGTCVLGHLTGPLCDALLGQAGSEDRLADLERRGVFTQALDDEGGYRYHEVLRSQLEAMLVESVGEAEAQARYRRAGELLEEHGILFEALRAYCRAADWEAAARLLGRQGERVIQGRHALVDTLPPALLEHDPWLLLADARRSLADGEFEQATAGYQRAEVAFGRAGAADICRRERLALAAWLDPVFTGRGHWAGLLRRATQRDPLSVRQELARVPGPPARLAEGLAALLAGHVREARAILASLAASRDADPLVAAGAAAAAALAGLLGGDPRAASDAEQAASALEQAGVAPLARMARVLARDAVGPLSQGGAEAVPDRADGSDTGGRDGRAWEAALTSLLGGLSAVVAGDGPVDALDRAAAAARSLDAPVLEAWARGAHALALSRAGRPLAREAAVHAEGLMRAAGVPGIAPFAYGALALAGDGPGAAELVSLAANLQADLGLAVVDPAVLLPAHPTPAHAVANGRPSGNHVDAPPAVLLRCFGRFEFAIRGDTVDCEALKPRARAVLYLLASQAGRPVHREELVEALWPEVDAKAGMRNLQVAVSSVRQLLEPGVARGAAELLVRAGDTYRLDLSEGDADIVAFERALADARAARAAGDHVGALASFERALDAYHGELLPEAGPAEWVVKDREAFRLDAADAAHGLAELLLEQGSPGPAAAVCERGLRIDRYRDGLWRLLAAAFEQAGDQAAATRAKRAYAEVLEELGVAGGATAG